VFRFGPYASPISIQVGDKKVFRLAIELRYIYKVIISTRFQVYSQILGKVV
jgi:hypothetical protein